MIQKSELHQTYKKYLSEKNKKIKETKESFLQFLAYKVELNNKANGKHHRRIIKNNLDIRQIINIFDSSITRLEPIESYDLSDNLIVVQVFFFDIFKDIFFNGFTYDNEDYIFFTASAGQIRTKKAVFIKKSFYEKHEKTIMCGLTLDKINANGGNNPNKHLAYTALSNSATDEWTDFNIDRTIVVDDFETLVYGTYDFVDDETYSIKRVSDYVPIPHTDGAGMILPEVSQYNFMIRMPWIKGLLGVFDFKKFIIEHNCSPIIKDIYGKEHNIIEDNIQIILTKSQFKLWKYYDSWEEYKDNFKKYNCKAGICNDERTVEFDKICNTAINYQMLQTLTDITDEELKTIATSSMTRINELCSNVRNLQREFHVRPNNRNMTYLQQAIQIYPDLMNDEFLKQDIRNIKNALVKRAKAGKLMVKGKYTFLLPDFYAFCQWLFQGIAVPEGLLQGNEVYCNLFPDSEKLDCLRSPHLYIEHSVNQNVAYKDNPKAGLINEWFITNGIYTSTHSLISKILMFDVDGDRSLVIADKTLIEVAERNIQKYNVVPLYYDMKKTASVQLTKDSLYQGLITAFTGGNIGIYSNNISKIWNSAIFENGTEQQKQMAIDTVKLLCMENNFVIDYAKTLYKPVRPKEIHEQIVSFTKQKVPHFFLYAKDKDNHQIAPINNSLVNRLDSLIPNPRIDLRKAKLGHPDYTLLVHDKDIQIDTNVINTYNTLNAAYRFKIQHQNEYNIKVSYISKYIKQALSQFNYTEEELADMLTKYLYSKKSCVSKDVLWFSYGKHLIKNLRYNLNKKMNVRTIQCIDCLDWFYAYGTNETRCPICQSLYRINYKHQKNTEIKTTYIKDKPKNLRKIRNYYI